MDCLLCSSPEQGEDNDKKSKSLSEFDYDLGEKYVRSLCQLLELPSEETYREYFILPNIGFCISCINFVGNVTNLFEQLEKLQKQISESRDQVQRRLLNFQCQAGGKDSSLLQAHPISVDILRQEIIKRIQIGRNSQTSEGEVVNSTEFNLENVVKEEEVEIETEYVDNGLSSADNCWSPISSPPSNHTEQTNEDQSSLRSSSSKPRSERTWKILEAVEGKTESIGTRPIVEEIRILKIVLTRLEECELEMWTSRNQNLQMKKKVKAKRVDKSHVKEVEPINNLLSAFEEIQKREDFFKIKYGVVPDSDTLPKSNSNEEPSVVQNIVIQYKPKPNINEANAGGTGTSSDLSIPCTVSDCLVKFKNAACLRNHLRKIHQIIPAKLTQTQCPHCPRTFTLAGKLETHIRTHTGERPFVCRVCAKRFRAKSYLKTHMIVQTGQKQQQQQCSVSCPQCPEKFLCKRYLQRHVERIHKKEKSFMCELCSKSFFYKVDLRDHQARFHAAELNLNPLQCQVCDKVLSSVGYLRIHENAHRGIGLKFKCTFEGCSSKFDRPSRLKNHMLTHTDELNHLCPQCGKRFRTKGSLVHHSLSHSEDRPHKCTDCPAAFKDRERLTRHFAAIHSKSTSFICLLCGEGFPVKRYLDRHIAKHTSGKLPIPGQIEETPQINSTEDEEVNPQFISLLNL